MKYTRSAPYTTEKEIIDLLKQRELFSPMIKKALRQAKNSHQRQLRDDGKPYLNEHIYPIVKDIVEFFNKRKIKKIPEELICSAILHDAMEDDVEFTPLRCKKEFSDEIYKILQPLTKYAKDNSKKLTEQEKFRINRKYLAGLEQAPKFSKLIKLSDRYNNLCSLRSLQGTEKYKRYIKETRELFLPFAKKYSAFYYTRIKVQLGKLDGK